MKPETGAGTPAVDPPDGGGGLTGWRSRAGSLHEIRRLGILLPFIVLFIYLSFASSAFATKTNMLNILDQQSAVLIIGAAGTLVLVSGGIDLSVGATYALAGVTAARFATHTSPTVAILLGIGAGVVVGLVNGLVVTVLRINSLIATLAMAFIVGGIGTRITNGNLLVLFDRPAFGNFAQSEYFTVKSSIWIMAISVVVIGLVLARATVGRYIYAVGGNPRAALLAGVPVNSIRVLAFVVSGAAAGLAGVVDTSRVLSAQASTGDVSLDVRRPGRNRRRRHEHPRRRGRGVADGRGRPLHRADRQRVRAPALQRPVRADHARRDPHRRREPRLVDAGPGVTARPADGHSRLLITGASGALGRMTAHLLLAERRRGELILVSRTPEALSDLAERGADVRFADFDELVSLRDAFAGADRMLLISASDVEVRAEQHRSAIRSASEAGVRHIVYTSGLNPEPPNPAVIAPSHHATERALAESGLSWTVLRNSLYAEYQVPEAAQALAAGGLCTTAARARSRMSPARTAQRSLRPPSRHRLTTVVYMTSTGPELHSAKGLAALYGEASAAAV